jgi:hypothetical protein
MNRVPLAIVMVCAVGVSSAYADPIPIFHATEVNMFMEPNLVGDNVRFGFTGPGLDIEGVGGMGCFSWCTSQPIPPGSPTPFSRVSIANFTTVVVNGTSFSSFDLGSVGTPFFDDFGGVNHVVNAFVGAGPGSIRFDLIMPTNGAWTLNFVPAIDENGNAAIVFANGRFSASAPAPTPEPATLGLVLAGSAGLGWITRRRKRR